MKRLFLVAVIASCFPSPGCAATLKDDSLRGVQAQNGTGNQTEEELTPLTEAEQQMDPCEIVLSQPDFTADLQLFVNEGFGGFSVTEHIARKGSRYREENGYWIFVGEIGKPSVRLHPEKKVYDDILPPREGLEDGDVFDPRVLGLESEASFAALGTVQIDGHKCVKIEVARKGEREKIYLYAALDLKNLVLIAQRIGQNRGMAERLRNISFDVSDNLVEIPSDFKPIEHDKWTKVESAKVTYNGKPSEDCGVFRAPGGELFIWLQDAHYFGLYLYRPKKKRVEGAFQGLLLSRSGTYIWQSKETEAFSLTDYRKPDKRPSDAHSVARVETNSITFQSFGNELEKVAIRVSW